MKQNVDERNEVGECESEGIAKVERRNEEMHEKVKGDAKVKAFQLKNNNDKNKKKESNKDRREHKM